MIDGYDRLRAMVEHGLEEYLPDPVEIPAIIHESMRYSACGGGKRLRGILALLTTELVGGRMEWALPTACGLEMIHAYSLIHDDLPCMDNDDLRRGKPTNHKIYGEAIALLAGNALLTNAFSIILQKTSTEVSQLAVQQALKEIVDAVGSRGMLGGQVLDLEAEGKTVKLEHLQLIHQMKTGALLLTSIRSGAILGGADGPKLNALTEYGQAFGLAFQITDDLLDITGSTKALGKPAGSDLRNGKSTYPALCGIEQAKQLAEYEVERAKAAVSIFGAGAAPFRQLADYLLSRDN